MTDEPTSAPPDGYGAAVEELEEILDEIEASAVDVDVLAERVRRATFLIEWCRGRIDSAREAVAGAAEVLDAEEPEDAD